MEKLLKNEGCNKRRSLGIFGLVFPPLISNLYYVEFSLFKKYILLFHKSMCLFNLLFLPSCHSSFSCKKFFFSFLHFKTQLKYPLLWEAFLDFSRHNWLLNLQGFHNIQSILPFQCPQEVTGL